MPDEIINRLREENWQLQKDNAQLWATVTAYANRVSELKAALRPFANAVTDENNWWYEINVDDFRAAAAALKEAENGH